MESKTERVARAAFETTNPRVRNWEDLDRESRLDFAAMGMAAVAEWHAIETEGRSKINRALRNTYMLAKRELNRARKREDAHSIEAWGHIVRFCHEAGMESSVLREPEGRIKPHVCPECGVRCGCDPELTDPENCFHCYILPGEAQ